MWEQSADVVEEVLEGGAQERTDGRRQGLGWRHHGPEEHNHVYLKTLDMEEDDVLQRDPDLRSVPVRVVVPLGGRHHLGHGGQKVVAGDSDRVDVQHELLRRGVDLRVATA